MMEQNLIINKRKITKKSLVALLFTIGLIGICLALYQQQVYMVGVSTYSSGNSKYPMYFLDSSLSGAKSLKAQKEITYKEGIEPSWLDSTLKMVWGNGRFRMKNANLVVVGKENLDKKLNQIRALACDFGWENTPKSTHLTFVDDDLVALYVRKIRYVNGVLYCTGRDLPVYVDIQREYWWVVRDVELLPSPHKEEFAKLMGKDKNNMVWIPKDSPQSECGRWEWEK